MDFKALFTQLATLYDKLTKQQKIIIASAVVGIVAFLIFLVVYTNNAKTADGYGVLFESLSSSDAAKVIDELEKKNIPYKISNNNTIKVPKDVVYKERIAIAAQGIPKEKGVGFELFDKQEFGATKFDQNVKYQRALEGELSRTISALDPIESATVSLAIPKESLFISKQIDPTASVMIKLKEGRALTPKQIRGIKNLVAAAVPRLKSENVMLVDSDGEILGDNDEEARMSELSLAQQRFKNKEERKLQQKIIDVIAPFVGGRDKVVAQVSVDYDFSIKNVTSEKYDPENVVRSEQTLEEKREGFTPKEVGGVPGTVSNIGPVQGLKENQTKEKYEKTTGTTNYEVGKTVSVVKGEFAKLKRITAAVLVDGKYKEKLDKDGNPTGEMEYEALSQSDLDALKSLASRAIGIDPNRGDAISVQNLQFKQTQINPADQKIGKFMQFTQKYVAPFSELFKYIIVIALLFLLYKRVITPFAEKMLEVTKEDEELEKPVLHIEEDEGEDLVEKVQAMRKKVEEQLGVSENFNEDDLKYEVLLEKVRTMVEENPEEIAALLQALLIEEQENTKDLSSK
ncbi:Flagellar M-ring protein FliF [hydrothermal vent metagenome]|uniref:Flagellar M-ring protein FliF n=1 Tax=hydrothermal vent metagenome TaxID=652676 RepID=A0A1W1C4T4_9ZZZZ